MTVHDETREAGNGQREEVEIRAQVGVDARLEGEDRWCRRRPTRTSWTSTYVHGGGEALAPCLDPADGPPELESRVRDQEFLGIELDLAAESSTDVGDDHAHACLGQSQGVGEQGPHPVGNLGRRPHRQRSGAVRSGDDRAPLEGKGADPRLDQAKLGMMLGPGEDVIRQPQGFGGQALGVEAERIRGRTEDPVADVALELVMDPRRLRPHGRLGIGDGGQGLEIRFDELEASWPCMDAHATTMAIGWPTKQTLSLASA